MATLILTAAGSALGGPVGGAIGALLGQRVDRAVLGTRREGPRLTELAVQTSSYGTQIPKLFGTMRVAGTVIWATDLVETRSTTGGKGAKTSVYAYAANFAVLLSARSVRDVRRVWADGRLLRGAAGDWKVRTGFRVHLGSEDQAVDPLIASAEGVGLAPAHRGCAYVVFEGLELAEFGNRIPSLTFEVVADDGTVACGAVVRTLANEVTAADGGLALGGFGAAGGSVRAVLETCAQASGGWFAPDGDGLAFRTGGGAARTVEDAGFGRATGARTVAAPRTAPGVVAVSHYDAARDYQAGLQRARRPGGGVRVERVEVPAVIEAGAAKAVAEAVLARGDVERMRRTVAPGLAAIGVVPGDVVAIAGEAGAWRVARASLEAMAMVLELVRLVPGVVSTGASGGRVLAQRDAVAGRTVLAAFEIPTLDDALLDAPRLTIVAAGEGAGWRSASLLVSTDAGATWNEAGTTAAPGMIGVIEAPPDAGSAVLADLAGAMVVRLAHAGMLLTDADDVALDRGANLALVGDELLQFGVAEPLGGARWRLSRLLRGRRGSEWAIGAQAAGDRFVGLEVGAVRAVALPAGARDVRVLASGVGDTVPVAAAAILDGASVLPPSVARLRWEAGAPDEAVVRWVRRSRVGWRWRDGADVPRGEEAEMYVVTVTRTGEPDATTVSGTASVRVARPATVTVRQRGTHGDSRGATIVVPA
ncbi:phage tail protein [Sphingomonas sp.]|uniref:GTA baseplate fiber-binding domain-containing protein n=1 Tax=Sphingomonas sp. TaxID=28214 RepID=UPI0035BC089E